jgi:hypothetical protein
MAKNCIFTIVAPNYLGQALTLKESIKNYSSSVDFKIVVVSDEKIDFGEEVNSHVIYANQIGIHDYIKLCFSYNILEHCTNIKPACFKYFLNDYDFIYYIDPDIYFYQNPIELNKLFEGNDVLLSPHSLSPVLDQFKPTELEFLRTGTFNLGFIGVRRSLRVVPFLNWWSDRCEKFGINETNSGLFVDQKWIDLAPCFFDFIKITRHLGVNVGYWNLHERDIRIRDDAYFSCNDPLIFFHFSGLDPLRFECVSKHQTRFFLNDTMNLYSLFRNYSEKLICNSDNILKGIIPYRAFDNGWIISELARKYFWKNSARYSGDDLFSSHGKLYKDCRQKKLLIKIDPKDGNFGSQSNLSKFSLQIKVIEFILNAIKFIVGPVRFYLLKKYILQRFSLISDFYIW